MWPEGDNDGAATNLLADTLRANHVSDSVPVAGDSKRRRLATFDEYASAYFRRRPWSRTLVDQPAIAAMDARGFERVARFVHEHVLGGGTTGTLLALVSQLHDANERYDASAANDASAAPAWTLDEALPALERAGAMRVAILLVVLVYYMKLFGVAPLDMHRLHGQAVASIRSAWRAEQDDATDDEGAPTDDDDDGAPMEIATPRPVALRLVVAEIEQAIWPAGVVDRREQRRLQTTALDIAHDITGFSSARYALFAGGQHDAIQLFAWMNDIVRRMMLFRAKTRTLLLGIARFDPSTRQIVAHVNVMYEQSIGSGVPACTQ